MKRLVTGHPTTDGARVALVRVNAKGPVRVIRSGSEIKKFSGHKSGDSIAHTFTDNAHAGAWYRVEMRESGLPFAPMRLMSWAIFVAKH